MPSPVGVAEVGVVGAMAAEVVVADIVVVVELTLAGVAAEVASEPPLAAEVVVSEHPLVVVEGAEFEPLRVVGLLQEYVRHQAADPRFDHHRSVSLVPEDKFDRGTPERFVAISAEPERRVCARVLQVSTRVAFTPVGLASTPAQVVCERAVLVFKQVAFGPVSAMLMPVAPVPEWELVPEESGARVRWATPDADN